MKILSRYSPIYMGTLKAIEYKLTTKFGDYFSACIEDPGRGQVHCFIPEHEIPITILAPINPCLEVYYLLTMITLSGEYFGYILPLEFQKIEVQKCIYELIIKANQNTTSSELRSVEAGRGTCFLDSCKCFDVSGMASHMDDLYQLPSSKKNINPRAGQDD